MGNNLMILVLIILLLIVFLNSKKESYINYGEDIYIEKNLEKKNLEKSNQLAKISVVNNNNDNPLDYDLCKISINNDNRLDKVDCDVNINGYKNLNNYDNQTLFSDVKFFIGDPNKPEETGWNTCKCNCDGRCVEFGQTGNFYCFPTDYAKIYDYPFFTIFQNQLFRPT